MRYIFLHGLLILGLKHLKCEPSMMYSIKLAVVAGYKQISGCTSLAWYILSNSIFFFPEICVFFSHTHTCCSKVQKGLQGPSFSWWNQMSSKWQRSWAIELLWFMTSQCASEFCLQLVYSKKPEMGYNTTAQTSQVVRKRIAKVTCQIRLHLIIWMDLPWWGMVMRNISLIEINIHLPFVCKKKSTR